MAKVPELVLFDAVRASTFNSSPPIPSIFMDALVPKKLGSPSPHREGVPPPARATRALFPAASVRLPPYKFILSPFCIQTSADALELSSPA